MELLFIQPLPEYRIVWQICNVTTHFQHALIYLLKIKELLRNSIDFEVMVQFLCSPKSELYSWALTPLCLATPSEVAKGQYLPVSFPNP